MVLGAGVGIVLDAAFGGAGIGLILGAGVGLVVGPRLSPLRPPSVCVRPGRVTSPRLLDGTMPNQGRLNKRHAPTRTEGLSVAAASLVGEGSRVLHKAARVPVVPKLIAPPTDHRSVSWHSGKAILPPIDLSAGRLWVKSDTRRNRSATSVFVSTAAAKSGNMRYETKRHWRLPLSPHLLAITVAVCCRFTTTSEKPHAVVGPGCPHQLRLAVQSLG